MVVVKIARSDQEREAAYDVRKKVFVEEQGVPLSLEMDEFDKTSDHFIVYQDDTPIGAGRIREIEDGIGKVERVCVLKDFRGKHLGNLIMLELEKHAKSTGMKKLILNAQSYAVPFYEKLGYTVTSPEFMDADIPHRAMEKDISI
ncbi:GNAT family N-acetyltransferase [Sporosarcina sp. FSL W8-0480]|uniref:GNAT family N-acetyltransferase n=1 Tax=Sporosarcina sp. FSL W8-0480 TaxID=2954701 RepID=UPI0030DCAE5C